MCVFLFIFSFHLCFICVPRRYYVPNVMFRSKFVGLIFLLSLDFFSLYLILFFVCFFFSKQKESVLVSFLGWIEMYVSRVSAHFFQLDAETFCLALLSAKQWNVVWRNTLATLRFNGYITVLTQFFFLFIFIFFLNANQLQCVCGIWYGCVISLNHLDFRDEIAVGV